MRFAGSTVFLVLLLPSGCAVREHDSAWPPRRPLGRTLATVRPAVDPASSKDPSPGPLRDRPLSLKAALAFALLNNPHLATFARQVRIQEANVLQVGADDGSWVEISDGLSSGTMAASKNSLVLKASWQQQSSE